MSFKTTAYTAVNPFQDSLLSLRSIPVFTAIQINAVTWQETVNKCSSVRLHSAGHHLPE